MLALFTKKKIREDKLAKVLANALLKMSEDGFPTVVESINEDPEFERCPCLNANDNRAFLLLITAGNLSTLDRFLDSGTDKRVKQRTVDYLAVALDLPPAQLGSDLTRVTGLMKRLNHPSKNVVRGMSKAFFQLYDLIPFQQDYFVGMNTDNPISRKKLDDLLEHFLWDWDAFLDDHKVCS